ncbi:G-protein coupled receptor Mth2-like isoform X1 [Ostrinia nubilalis]|uniref:G-protein coupled receptor Mth2-like isoform X1 n=1 Tax=Ostrinia nubilalis TaxID=29057 RepID=UPI00308240F9
MRLIVLCVVFITQKILASDLCHGKVCIKKCCPDDHIVRSAKNCTPYTGKVDLKISVYNEGYNEIGLFEDHFYPEAGIFLDDGFKKRALNYTILYTTYFLMQNGTLFLERKKSKQIHAYETDRYCIDAELAPNKTLIPAVYFTKDAETPRNDDPLKWGFLVSSVFLLLLLVVYSLLPELRNLGGLIFMAYVASLMMGFIFYFCIAMGKLTSSVCLVITCLTYFFMLASFGWLNVMSYDIFWTFRGYAKARPIHRRGENIKFLMYCAYAFGVPLGLTIALVTLNEVNNHRRLGGIVPEIPLKGCFLEGPAKYVYLYAPMLLMILANWVFFLLTAFNIWRLTRGGDVLRAQDSAATGSSTARQVNKQRFLMYLKLSVLMGLSWILEVVSSYNPDFEGWYITDLYNVFMGVIIFVIFVCKRKVWNMLKKRYTNFKHQHKFSLRSKSQTRSSQDESTTQSIPLQSPVSTTASTNMFELNPKKEVV